MILQVQDFYLHLSRANKKNLPCPKAVRKCQCQSFQFSRTYIIPRTCPLPNKQDSCFFNLERGSFCRVEDVKVNSLRDIIGPCLFMAHVVYIHHAKTKKLISCQLNWKPNKSMLFFFSFFGSRKSPPKNRTAFTTFRTAKPQDAPGGFDGRFINHEGS